MDIRLLKASEIDVRVQTVKENGFSLLLYKDARVDMAILDEVFGAYGWQRKHEVINGNLFCTVSIYDKETNQWIDKQDVGTESYTEKEKGQASDSFKRACFNVGIGRELYTAPFIWINNNGDIKEYKGKLSVSTSFKVSEIGYNDDREITTLVIIDNKGKERYRLGRKSDTKTSAPPTPMITKEQQDEIFKLAREKNYTPESMTAYLKNAYNKPSSMELTYKEADVLIKILKGNKGE